MVEGTYNAGKFRSIIDPKLRRKSPDSMINDSRSRKNIQRSTKRRRTKCPPHVLCRRRAVSRRSGCCHAHARQIQPLPGGNPLFEVVQPPSLGRQRLRSSLPSSDIPGDVRLPIFSPGQGIGTESYRFLGSEKSVPDEFKGFRRRSVNLLQQQDCPASPVAALLASGRSKAPIDCNINQKDTTWFRFQSDTGMRAVWTDPINPVFDAIAPQPLYSFAAGHTHVFSQGLVNYFSELL
jgi:hypothetical protein